MSELKGACVIGQSGGPTSVINSSVLGALETALDSCVRAGVLDGWEYCGAKKAKLSDSEVDIGDYATFIGLYVRFRMGRMNDED